jgi:hypothetical protein
MTKRREAEVDNAARQAALEAAQERERIQHEAAEIVRVKAAEVERVREAAANEAILAEARRKAEIEALAGKAAAEVTRLKKAYADREARDAQERVEIQKI